MFLYKNVSFHIQLFKCKEFLRKIVLGKIKKKYIKLRKSHKIT